MSAVLDSSTSIALDARRTLGDIAASLPGATAVFRRHKLDFCCGGNVALGEAAATKGLDADELLSQLQALQHDDDAERTPTDPAALIDHILHRYHEVHRAQLPELEKMARRVEAVHADHPAVPAGLASLLDHMQGELLDHMAKEEQVLFPVLRSGGHPMAQHPIGVMRHEHVEHGKALEQLEQLTNGMQPPAGACTTWRALYVGLAQLKDDLMMHIHLENNVLFPQFEPSSACGCSGPGACA